VTILLSNLTVISDPLTWQGQWSPASPMNHAGAAPTPQPGLCLASEALDQLPAAPPGLFRGLALVYEQLEGTEDWGLVLQDLEGGDGQVLVRGTGWGALSPDGSQLAYSAADGIRIRDIAGGQEILTEAVGGYDMHWSPDGSQIAFIGGSSIGTHVIQADGSGARQISDQSYEAMIGWSPDGAEIYFAIPFTGGAAWQVRAVNTTTLAWRDLFVIENGSAKSLSAALSPDGSWIAYRSRDHTGVYLVRPNGEEAHQVLEKVTQGISGIVWGRGGWLGVSVVDSSPDERSLVLVQPETCLAYALPTVRGDLEGLHLE
jgi:Tol biopolymer transport system component